MSAKAEIWDYFKLLSTTPDSDIIVGSGPMYSLLDTLMKHMPKMPVFRGKYTSPKLLMVVAPMHFGITTLVKSYCRDNSIFIVFIETTSRCAEDNIAVIKKGFDHIEDFLNTDDQKVAKKFIIYFKEPLFSFYNQADVSELFLNRFRKLKELAHASTD